MSKARELQAVDDARAMPEQHRVAESDPGRRLPSSAVEKRPTGNHVTVKLTVPQAQALVEAGEEWPNFTDMSGTQQNASRRGAKELRSALLGIGRGPTWK